ncbi:hypothetical protein [Facklamia sp. P12955]|uniref:hypothetical protein n=1 Tax=unclassified Facklamia TaxID=2622293 RepID=UPI003D17D44F
MDRGFKLVNKLFIFTILLALLYTPISAKANQITTESLTETKTSIENKVDQELLKKLSESLIDLKEVEEFEVKMKWTNLDKNQAMGQATYQVDVTKGDLKGDLKFQMEDDYPETADFGFISYGRHRLFYVKEFAFLDSLAYFKQAFFNYQFDKQMAKYTNLYTEFSNETIGTVNLNEKPATSLLLIPNRDKLMRVDKGQLSFKKDQYHLNIERIDIPSLFFDKHPFLSISYRLDHLIQPSTSSIMSEYQDWENQFNHQIKINEQANDFLFGTKIESEFSNHLQVKETEHRTPQFNKTLNLMSQGLTDKLTSFTMDFDPDKQILDVTLEGIVENVAFNFFSKDTAELTTKRVRLEYSFKPKKVVIPQRTSLKTISPAAADYLMEELLSKEKK